MVVKTAKNQYLVEAVVRGYSLIGSGWHGLTKNRCNLWTITPTSSRFRSFSPSELKRTYFLLLADKAANSVKHDCKYCGDSYANLIGDKFKPEEYYERPSIDPNYTTASQHLHKLQGVNYCKQYKMLNLGFGCTQWGAL